MHHDDIIEELLDALDREYPDPVDVFEDDLARRLGLRRHPLASQDDWRRSRVRFINAAEDAGDIYLAPAVTISKPSRQS